MYSCGITPYDSAHLGHAAVYLTFDILQRRLRDLGHETRCVRNVTDVDDDILRKARELGVHYLDLAAEEIARFDADMAALGLLPAWSEPRATSAISEILSLIGAVLDGGHAYQSGGAVYFDVTTLPRVRRRSATSTEADDAGAGGRARRQPRRPQQARPARLRAVAAVAARRAGLGVALGPGPARAGTSSARRWSLRELGETIDIHGGGRDLVFPHHECETAQSESVTGQPLRPPLAPRRAGRAWTGPRCRSRSATWSSSATC